MCETIQLRLKDASESEVRRQIQASLEICIRHGCQLIVNDYWREAIAAGADYIHLGQEDLAAADIPTIKAAGIKLGISTHNEEELAIALAAEPDYVALGPIYETKLKVMTFGPQGLDRVRQWKAAHRRDAAVRHRRNYAGASAGRRGSRCRHASPSSRIFSPTPTRRRACGSGLPGRTMSRRRLNSFWRFLQVVQARMVQSGMRLFMTV